MCDCYIVLISFTYPKKKFLGHPNISEARKKWRSKEMALLTFMNSTLSPSILALTVGCTTAMEVWKVLENRFSSICRSYVMNLKGELHNIKKGTGFVDIYLQKIKVVRDNLLDIGVIVDDEELLRIAIKGLPKNYNAFRSTIRTRST